MNSEFIIALTEHRAIGNIFVPLIIEREKSYYTVKFFVKIRDLNNYPIKLTESELQLLKLIENCSDEMLVKKFARGKDKIRFFNEMDAELFQKNISPHLDKYMYRCVLNLMNSNTRLFYKEAKYAHLYEEDIISINKTFSDSLFIFNRNENGTYYKLNLNHEGKPVDLIHKSIKMVSSFPCCFVLRNQLYVFDRLSGKKIQPFLTKDKVSIPKQAEDKYYQSFILNTIRESNVEASGFEIIDESPNKKAIISLEQDLSLNQVIVLKFRYGNTVYQSDSVNDTFVSFEKKDDNYLFRKFKRDKDWEAEKINLIKELGLKYQNGFWVTVNNKIKDPFNNYLVIIWLNQNHEIIIENNFEIHQNKLTKTYFTGNQSLEIKVKSTEDWFDIYATVIFGEYQIPFARLRKYILNGIREFELPSGEIAILPDEWFTKYKDIFPHAKLDGNTIRIKNHHFSLIQNSFAGLDKNKLESFNRLKVFEKNLTAIPEGLNARLRQYQHEGFTWMHRLYELALGGCLADDMGLGKTIQTLALILNLKKKKSASIFSANNSITQLSLFDESDVLHKTDLQNASLIIMPTSLVHNWDNEILKFSPSLKVYRHIGSQRKKGKELINAAAYYDVILTTYGTIRNDVSELLKIDFFYIILDEGQNIKNPISKTYKSIIELKSKYKLIITGTPIENSLSDLWSQINFVNKGLLGSLPYFKREFLNPIEKKNDPEKEILLQRLINPFVLRRTKEEVAKDLPTLTEQIWYCEMTETQKEIYETEKSAIRNYILKNIESNGISKSAIVILQGLTKLRQLSNHPSLINNAPNLDSGKFNEIYRCLKSLVAENHKVLVFSSFVKHLELLQSKIESKNWKYSLLTGKTTNRMEVIKQFQDDPENHIFLISLKAGGVGLNLTSADYVFIIDPWWNPAAENQAINRAHRIGQDKKVFVYRFITENSIEEKIQVLKSKKSALAEKFISSVNPIGSFIKKEEIIDLFE